MGENEQGYRFEKIEKEEAVRKYIYGHQITADNYLEHQEQLLPLFTDRAAYTGYMERYFQRTETIFYHSFFGKEQHLDVFVHPRYIQQEPHIHDFFEMKFQLRGSGTIHVGDELIFMKESDLCVIAPYVLHTSEVYSDDATMINLVLPPDFLEQLFPRILNFENIWRRFFLQDRIPETGDKVVYGSYLYRRTSWNPDVRKIVEDILRYYSYEKGRSILKNLQTESELETMLLLLLDPENDAEEYAGENERNLEEIRRIVDYMKGNLRDARFQDVTELLHFSASYTSRFIKKETGYTFQKILLILRMQEAARLLRSSELPVDVVAESVGLSGKTNFYEKFRQFYGMTPAELRRQR